MQEQPEQAQMPQLAAHEYGLTKCYCCKNRSNRSIQGTAMLVKMQVFWDVMLCYKGVPDILKDGSAVIFIVKQSKKTTSP
jgi:hypothetical protein